MSFNIQDTLPLVKPNSGCDFHRILLPYLQLGYDFKAADKGTLEESVEGKKIVTFNRESGVDPTELERLKKQNGFKVVIDMDDYHKLHKGHILYNAWESLNYSQRLEDLFASADAITTTTPRLAEKLKVINSNTYVIPNAVPFTQDEGQWKYEMVKEYGGKPRREFSKSGAIKTIHRSRFAWAGGSTHLKDIQSISRAFYEFPHLDFKLCGYDNPYKDPNSVWDKMEALASLKGKNPNYKRAKTKDLWNYMNHLNDVDVAIAPLEALEWNGYKSSLKAYEAGVKKCAFICTGIPPYTDDIPEDCATFCDSEEEWMDAIEDHLDLEYVKEKAEKLHKWVKENRNLAIVSQYRLKIYEHIANGGKPHEIPSYEQLLAFHKQKEPQVHELHTESLPAA